MRPDYFTEDILTDKEFREQGFTYTSEQANFTNKDAYDSLQPIANKLAEDIENKIIKEYGMSSKELYREVIRIGINMTDKQLNDIYNKVLKRIIEDNKDYIKEAIINSVITAKPIVLDRDKIS